MWVDKQEWKRLNERVQELESQMRGYSSIVQYTVYEDGEEAENYRKYGWFMHYQPASQFLSVKDVVSHILSHLGLRLTYTKGTPAKTGVCNAAPSSDTK